MIAQHEETLRRNYHLVERPGIRVIAGHIVFVERLAVYIHLTVINADVIPGNSDDALDVALRRVARIAEDHDVATVNRLPAIDELVDENPLLIFESRHHARALNLYGLVEKDDDERRNGERHQQITRPDGHNGQWAQRRFLLKHFDCRLRSLYIRHRTLFY